MMDLPSPAMRMVSDMIDKVAPLGSTVFIQGPSGAGKEIVARSIHLRSDRSTGPFVPVNCGAIPRDRPGLMELSSGGTLFLDEIGDMPLDMQVKLLRMIEERSFTRVGGSKAISIDVRFICATHRDLRQLIDEQKFREDLYYRINVFPILLPPLKERLEDIPALVGSIIKRFEAQGFPKAPVLTDQAIEILKSYDWPGNVRELRNILERAGALYPDRPIDGEIMSGMIFPGQPRPPTEEDDAIWEAVAAFAGDEPRASISAADERDGIIRALLAGEGFNLKDHIAALETDFIRIALADCDHSVSAAARMLGIQRTTLIEKMRKFSIGRPD
jgi:sigma-54 dependent transcriptional regulator, flagellar regulatory protein